MMKKKDFIHLLLRLPLFYLTIAAGASPEFPKCKKDKDCPETFICKLVCITSCNSLCVPLKKINQRPQQALRSRESAEIDAPFAADANPFAAAQADAPLSTPITISEKELEAELNKSGNSFPQPPSKFIAGPENEGSTSVWTLAPGELATDSTEQQIWPPSFSPQPPAFSATPETSFENTITTIQQTSIKQGSSSDSKELTEPPYKSSWEKEGMKNFKKRKGSVVDKTTPSFRSSETPIITAPPRTIDSPEQLEEKQKSKKTTPAKQAFSKARGKLKTPKTKKPVKSLLITKKTVATSSLADGCPAPQICGKNCGVVIDDDGCQTCRCLWTSGPCSTDLDCPGQGLFCDLGRCECKTGYEHDTEAGVCRRANLKNNFTQQGVRLSSSAGGHASGKSASDLPVSKQLKKIENIHQNRARRSPPFAPGKPMREERLQWPGFKSG